MSTILTYNGITFSDIKTKALEQKTIFTEDGVSYLYDEYTISINAVFALGLDPAEENETPAQTWTRIQGCLSKPRQALTFEDGFTLMIDSPGGGVISDAKNGPMPLGLKVSQLAPGSYLVEFSIRTWIYNCCEGSVVQPYIAHRWTETQQINDQDFRSVVVRKGRLSFRADLLAGNTPDTYRSLITLKCPLRPRCLRRSEYTVTSDGLNIDYSITDTEQFAMPLAGLTKFESEYRVVTQKVAVCSSEMIVRCWGANNVSKTTVFQAAFTILAARLAPVTGIFAGAGAAKGSTIMGGYFMDKLHENYVEISVKLLIGPFSTTFYGLVTPGTAGGTSTLDPTAASGFSPIPNAPAVLSGAGSQPDPKAFATLGLMLMQPAFSDPCLDAWITQAGSTIDVAADGDTAKGQNTPATVTVTTTLPTQTSNLVTSELASGVYIKSAIDIAYEQDQHIVQMPVASSTVTAASFAYLAQPTMKKVVTYTIEKSGAQPTLPATVSSDTNEILLWSDIQPNAVQLEADNYQMTWRVEGKYIYGIVDPTQQTLYAGRNPYVEMDFEDTALSPNNFVNGLTSQDSTGGGNGYANQP